MLPLILNNTVAIIPKNVNNCISCETMYMEAIWDILTRNRHLFFFSSKTYVFIWIYAMRLVTTYKVKFCVSASSYFEWNFIYWVPFSRCIIIYFTFCLWCMPLKFNLWESNFKLFCMGRKKIWVLDITRDYVAIRIN